MKKTARPENPLTALEGKYGRERFQGVLTLAFFEVFWAKLSDRTPSLPLYSFSLMQTGPHRLHAVSFKGKAGAPTKDSFYVSVQDLLCACALSGIPLLISHGMETVRLAEDFLAALFGVSPLTRLPVFQEEGNAGESPPAQRPGSLSVRAPLLLDVETLSPRELKILARIEAGAAHGDLNFSAVFISDNRDTGARNTALQNFFNITIPCLYPRDAFSPARLPSKATSCDPLAEGLMERASHYLEVEKKELQGIRDNWPACYSAIVDATLISPAFTGPALEWFHLTCGILAEDRKPATMHEARLLMQWMEKFDMHGIISLPELERQTDIPKGENLFQDTGSPLTPANVERAYKLASFFSTLNRVRLSLSSPSSLETFFEIPASVSIHDLFISFYIIISEHASVKPHELESTLNGLAESYYDILDAMARLSGPEGNTRFHAREASVISGALRRSIRDALEREGGVAAVIQSLVQTGKKMPRLFHPGPCAFNLQLLLLMTDIFSLAGFLHYYRKELDLIINCFDHESSIDEVIAGLRRFFHEKKKSEALTIPPVFPQRIPRILR